jgi:hypothetical protein
MLPTNSMTTRDDDGDIGKSAKGPINRAAMENNRAHRPGALDTSSHASSSNVRHKFESSTNCRNHKQWRWLVTSVLGRNERPIMTGDPADWHQALARVSGQLVRGEGRVKTQELLMAHLGVPVTDRACRRLRRVMREIGWRGPRLMRWGKQTLKGYWRHPTVFAPQRSVR